jgi:hypothetical protein
MRYLVIAGGALLAGMLVAGTSLQSVLPFLILLACPVMMIFMMRGMGGHADQRDHNDHQRHSAADRDRADR